MKLSPLLAIPVTAILVLSLNPEGLATVFKASRRLSGFSIDNSHYIYLESSRNPVTDVPEAQIQIINIEDNSCVSNGCLKTEYDRTAYSLTNQAAEDDLLNKTLTIRQDLGLERLKVGIELPIIERRPNYPANRGVRTNNSNISERSETLKIQLKDPKNPLQIRLEQRHIPSVLSGGSAAIDRASMRIIVLYNYLQFTIGDLNNYREAVTNYSIREVRLSPNRDRIVVLIDMKQPTEEGLVETTFVQSFSLKKFGEEYQGRW